MSSGLELRSIGSLLSEHFSGAWGSDPGRDSPNATVLRSTDIDDEGHVDLARGAQRQLSPRDLSAKRLRAGDILLEASGGGPGKPVGRPAWFADETPVGQYATSNFFKVLRANPDLVDAKFLLYALVLLVKRPEIWRFQQQTTGITNLKFSEYLKHVIVAPPLPEQRRIANVLDALDEQIRISDELVSKLIRLRRGLLRDVILDLPEVEPDTQRGTLGDFVDWLSGGTPAKASPEFWGGAIPWITPKDMKFALLRKTVDSLTSRGVAAGSRLAPPEAVYIVVRGMILAHTFPVSRIQGPAAFNQDVKALLPRSGLLPDYLMYWSVANSESILRLVGESTHGTKKLDLADLKAFPAVIPPLASQYKALAVLRAMDSRIDSERASARKARSQKHGLLTDLLTGRVRVPEQAVS